jgi:hypothetical protein
MRLTEPLALPLNERIELSLAADVEVRESEREVAIGYQAPDGCETRLPVGELGLKGNGAAQLGIGKLAKQLSEIGCEAVVESRRSECRPCREVLV